MTVGEKIRQHRKAKKLSQKELGKISGTAETTVRQYEGGKRTPRLEQIEKIANALEVSPYELMGWEYFDQTIDTTELSQEVGEISLFESYLSSLGYTVETLPDGERSITKDDTTAEFELDEFNELQAKYHELRKRVEELQFDNQAIIEARIQKKAKK